MSAMQTDMFNDILTYYTHDYAKKRTESQWIR